MIIIRDLLKVSTSPKGESNMHVLLSKQALKLISYHVTAMMQLVVEKTSQY